MVGTSDTWLMNRFPHQSGDSVYHIEDCWISGILVVQKYCDFVITLNDKSPVGHENDFKN